MLADKLETMIMDLTRQIPGATPAVDLVLRDALEGLYAAIDVVVMEEKGPVAN